MCSPFGDRPSPRPLRDPHPSTRPMLRLTNCADDAPVFVPATLTRRATTRPRATRTTRRTHATVPRPHPLRRSTSKDSMASDGSGSSKTGASRKLSVVGGLLGGGSRGRSPTSSGQVSPKSSEGGSSSPGHERPPAPNLAPAVAASLEGRPSGEGGGTDLSQPPWPTSLRNQQGRPSPSPAGSLPGSQPGSQYGGSVGGMSHYSHLPSPCSSVHTSVHGTSLSRGPLPASCSPHLSDLLALAASPFSHLSPPLAGGTRSRRPPPSAARCRGRRLDRPSVRRRQRRGHPPRRR